MPAKTGHVLALDLGTSALKAFVATSRGEALYCASAPYPNYAPQPLWVEQHPEDWLRALAEAVVGIPAEVRADIAAISFSGHMSSAVIVDAALQPLTPCLPLSDMRGGARLASLDDMTRRVVELTGNGSAATCWALKVLWLLEQPGVAERMYRVLFAKDFLRATLTGCVGMEYTDAGNTGLMDYATAAWDARAVAASGIPPSLLPEIHAPYDLAGALLPAWAERLGLPAGIPVFHGGADMACGALGSGLREADGNVSITLGSCATMLTVLPADIDCTPGVGKISFHPFVLPGTRYALGSHFTGGQGANWFAGLFAGNVLAPDYALLNALAAEAEAEPAGANGLLMLPFLVGSGSPYYRGEDQSALIGMTLSTTRGAMFRAVLEGIAINLHETQQVLEQLITRKPRVLIGGGGVRIAPWGPIIADVFGCDLIPLPVQDASALGAAMIGAYGAGLADSIYPPQAASEEPIRYRPENRAVYAQKILQFRAYYAAVEGVRR